MVCSLRAQGAAATRLAQDVARRHPHGRQERQARPPRGVHHGDARRHQCLQRESEGAKVCLLVKSYILYREEVIVSNDAPEIFIDSGCGVLLCV